MQRLLFAAVFLIFCMRLAMGVKTADARILLLALAATVIADFNLMFNANPMYGLIAFCCVQVLYCCRYGGAGLCGILALVWCALLPLAMLCPPVIAAAVMYAAAFALSLGAACANAEKKYPYPLDRFVVWGMGLFACCDALVAINYLYPGSTWPLAWVFYLPGQTLLSLSGLSPVADMHRQASS